MGYYTQYSPIVVEPDKAAFMLALGEMSEALQDHESFKWYDHEEDIAKAMIASGTTFVLVHGVGEENGDVWDKEFRLVDGKVEVKAYRYTLVRNEHPE